ncbi:FAD-dependent oxidoreductase [Mucilaginibacter corticis]|uniref:FAD-dependent oxidoreductase n=1 Tax=Mucilaginibacter corticis TaxID=2597670 RepID=A0A556MWR9_9SPHI|nr:FAD-dependent oxidoreductase [Mucilaginibacter corticis]TSJ44370.1 FAD-dependent oxidoreductase [Mucilaginibacter corticis]
MNLYEQLPYWLMKDGLVAQYPSLDENLEVDVAVMGAGISAALTAWHLKEAGLSIAVFDRRHVGLGSTAASTAFLQYEIDTPLTELTKLVGEQNAVRAYQLCRESIYTIENLCATLKPHFDFHIVPSLQYATYQTHVAKLRAEYELRKKHGFVIDWLDPKDIQSKFNFDAPAAVFSKDGGEVDAYLLTHALFKDLVKHGHRVFNNTQVQDIEYNHGVTLTMKNGVKVKAKKLVIACGYESLKYIPKKIADINSTYALVSEPLSKEYFWHKNSLVWETAVPYQYFRVVSENRILIGGCDDPYHHPHIAPNIIAGKTNQLVAAFRKRMPHIPLKADFSWAGAFASTKDGLPYIGSIPERPNTYFALGFGGNGITFSVIAAEIIRDLILNKKNNNTHLFEFNR